MFISIPAFNFCTKFSPVLRVPWVRHVGITMLVLAGKAIDDIVSTIASEEISGDQLCVLGRDVGWSALGFPEPGWVRCHH